MTQIIFHNVFCRVSFNGAKLTIFAKNIQVGKGFVIVEIELK
jgi:hypothetical protein